MRVTIARIKSIWVIFPSEYYTKEDLVYIIQKDIDTVEEFDSWMDSRDMDENTFGYKSTRDLIDDDEFIASEAREMAEREEFERLQQFERLD